MDPQSFRRARTAIPLLLLLATAAGAAGPGTGPAAGGFAAKTKGFTRRDGLLVTWLDRRAGSLLVELPRPSGPRNECGSFLLSRASRPGSARTRSGSIADRAARRAWSRSAASAGECCSSSRTFATGR